MDRGEEGEGRGGRGERRVRELTYHHTRRINSRGHNYIIGTFAYIRTQLDYPPTYIYPRFSPLRSDVVGPNNYSAPSLPPLKLLLPPSVNHMVVTS